MLDSIYDQQFRALKQLKWLPWVGKNYAYNTPENKILLIGESHYLSKEPNKKDEYENPNMTRLIAKNMGVDGNKYGSDFFVNTYKLLLRDRTFDERGLRKLWDNIVFYNFIQRPMTNSKHRPEKNDLLPARENFFDLLNVLQPSVCVFLGLKAEQKLNNALEASDYKVIKPIAWKNRINNGYGRYGRIESPDGQMIKLIFVRHPSQFFSYKLWNDFLQKYMPEQIEWLKQITT